MDRDDGGYVCLRNGNGSRDIHRGKDGFLLRKKRWLDLSFNLELALIEFGPLLLCISSPVFPAET